jgi:sigma-B regulation protein RsbU (phosphoserine phosphatase)
MNVENGSASSRITVLLIDDQPLIGEAVRRMITSEPDIDFHYLKDPLQAIQTAHAVHPTVILQDLVMPEVDGLDLVTEFRAQDYTREIPMIVLSTKEEATTKARAFAVGANDYLVKLPDRIELLARIRYHSKGYINLLQRNEAYRALAEQRQRLADEIESAAKYVQSLLPAKIPDGPVRADWQFIPSTALSGDTFGYHWLDERHFAFYLIDVVGHGVAAALLSVSVLNAIRSQSLPDVDFRNPGEVMTALNQRFQMSQQSEKYFTGWCGVYDVQERRITYAGGGHPPAFLITGDTADRAELKMLESTGPMIGAIDELRFECESIDVGHYGRLFLYSDGVYEIHLPGGGTWTFDEFKTLMGQLRADEPAMDRLRQHTLTLSGQDCWDDDFSIVELRF